MAGRVITIAQQKGGAGKTTLAANIAVALQRRGSRVALLDTDPQGSLGRWFLARRDRLGEPDLGFSTASAWGVSYECEKLRKEVDYLLIDTPPKVDADLRPALRAADLVLIPVAASHVDFWAVDGVLDLAEREGRPARLVVNRLRAGTRLAQEVVDAAAALGATQAHLANRVVYAETLGIGLGVLESRRGPAWTEIEALSAEVVELVGGG